ncbi:hypothetical protein EB796_014346 [Bugula neritina]|uniref:Uncharacterized protein n=1 Tax=Bugula neritina TaxID=10212 RepID=A0A7J7JM32_BUGNE|nr:hypothetical protein EB796_014346 [Bugula neritina]
MKRKRVPAIDNSKEPIRKLFMSHTQSAISYFDLVSRRRMEIPTSNGLYARHIIFVICWLDSTSLSGSLIINSLLFSFEY